MVDSESGARTGPSSLQVKNWSNTGADLGPSSLLVNNWSTGAGLGPSSLLVNTGQVLMLVGRRFHAFVRTPWSNGQIVLNPNQSIFLPE